MVQRHVDHIRTPTSLKQAFAGNLDLATDAALWLLGGKILKAVCRNVIKFAGNRYFVGDRSFPSQTHAFAYWRRTSNETYVVVQGGQKVDASPWDAHV